MTLKKYSTLALVLLLGLALYLFPEMRSWFGFLPFSLLVGVTGLVIFAPIIIARRRRHRNYWPIVVLTFICWPVALIWSFTDNVER